MIRVLVVAPTWLGDSVMSLPLVGFLAAAEGVRVTVVARGASGRVYCGVDGVSDLVVPPGGNRIRRIRFNQSVAKHVDANAAVILPPSFSSALGPYLAGVDVRVGVRSDARRFLLTASVSPRGFRDEHLSENYLRLGRLVLERLGRSSDHAFAVPRMRSFDDERTAVAAKLGGFGAGPGDYAVVVPGATFGPTKTWPKERYRDLVGRLSKEIPVVLGGSPNERGLCEFVANGTAGAVNLAGRTSIGEFVALLGGARVVAANDSGSPHVAASLGVPVVVIFGSTSPVWTAPLGDEVHVVREPVRCAPCFLSRCPTNLECYQGISVDKVLDAVRGALKKSVEKKVLR